MRSIIRSPREAAELQPSVLVWIRPWEHDQLTDLGSALGCLKPSHQLPLELDFKNGLLKHKWERFWLVLLRIWGQLASGCREQAEKKAGGYRVLLRHCFTGGFGSCELKTMKSNSSKRSASSFQKGSRFPGSLPHWHPTMGPLKDLRLFRNDTCRP